MQRGTIEIVSTSALTGPVFGLYSINQESNLVAISAENNDVMEDEDKDMEEEYEGQGTIV